MVPKTNQFVKNQLVKSKWPDSNRRNTPVPKTGEFIHLLKHLDGRGFVDLSVGSRSTVQLGIIQPRRVCRSQTDRLLVPNQASHPETNTLFQRTRTPYWIRSTVPGRQSLTGLRHFAESALGLMTLVDLCGTNRGRPGVLRASTGR